MSLNNQNFLANIYSRDNQYRLRLLTMKTRRERRSENETRRSAIYGEARRRPPRNRRKLELRNRRNCEIIHPDGENETNRESIDVADSARRLLGEQYVRRANSCREAALLT